MNPLVSAQIFYLLINPPKKGHPGNPAKSSGWFSRRPPELFVFPLSSLDFSRGRVLSLSWGDGLRFATSRYGTLSLLLSIELLKMKMMKKIYRKKK